MGGQPISGMRQGAAISIAVLAFDGVRLLDATGLLEVFDAARVMGVDYRVLLCSPDGADVTTSGGVRVGIDRRAADLGVIDTLVVPGGECLVDAQPSPALLAAFCSLAQGARRVVAIGTGSFALASVGLLDGRRATTHWRHTATLASRFPNVIVDEEASYVRDGHVLTSAGVSVGIDVALALVEEDAGDLLAHEIARDLVMFTRRRGEQPQLSALVRMPRPLRDLLRALCDDIAADPAADHSVPALAHRAGLSPRHLSRLLKAETGQTPTGYVASVRREVAIALVNGGATVAAAARRSGLGSEETLRRVLQSERNDHQRRRA